MKERNFLWMFALFTSGLTLGGPLFAPGARAWDNHALGSRVALESLPEVQAAPAVAVEPIEAFLSKEAKGLARLLEEEENWARQNVATYPPLPDSLRFPAGPSEIPLRQRFLRALRINPEVRLAHYLQSFPEAPGSASPRPRPPIPLEAVTLLPGQIDLQEKRFVALSLGEAVSALDVVATASDEPDHGLDIGLWEDSGTPFGKEYGFGKQPFGNPALSFSSQAPFHMGFFHEDAIVYKAAGFVRRTYPELRAHQFLSLARFAFGTGHDYWGWRFAGWGVHYIQDLTQPYHSTLLPGVSTLEMLWINSLDLIGIHGPKSDRVTLVSNRHLAFENYGYYRMLRELEDPRSDAPALQALRSSGDAPFETGAIRERITRESNALAALTDATLTGAMPGKYVSDPTYVFGVTETNVNLLKVLEAGPGEALAKVQGLFIRLMGNFGKHSRGFTRASLRRD